MTHLKDKTLLRYLDEELASPKRGEVKEHLKDCKVCTDHLHTLTEEYQQINDLLGGLAPDALDQPNSRKALVALQTKLYHEKEIERKRYIMFENLMKNKTLKNALTGIVTLAVLVGLLSFAPVQALASEFLSLFRVEGFTAVNVDEARLEEIAEAVGEDADFGDFEILEEAEIVEVASFDEAAENLSFAPRAIEGYTPDYIGTTDTMSARFTPDVEAIRVVFETLGLDPELIPDEADGQPFTITVQDSVMASYEADGFMLAQVSSVEIDAPNNVDMQQLGEAMLQLWGMTPREAAAISADIDWTTTLVLPVPQGFADAYDVEVDGTVGLVIEAIEGMGGFEGDSEHEMGGGRSLLWQKDGVIYMISSAEASLEELLALAAALD